MRRWESPCPLALGSRAGAVNAAAARAAGSACARARKRRHYRACAGRIHDGQPLPLSVADISDVLAAHPSPLPRGELDACLFALDAAFLDGLDEKPKPQKDVGSAWGGMVAAMNEDD